MADMTEEINQEPEVLTPEDYDKEYDKLWAEANGEDISQVEDTETVDEQSGSEATKPAEETTDEKEIKDEDTEPEEPALQTDEEKIDNDKDLSDQQKEEMKAFLKLKARGTELNLSEDEARELASKGLDYTMKTQELAQWRQLIENTKDIPENDINAIKALRNGNKDALLQLAKKYNIDLYDLDIEKEPEVPNYLEEVNQPNEELARIENRILADKETLPKVEQVLEALPKEFIHQMQSQPAMLEGLYGDIKNGVTDNVLGEALKSYYIKGGDFLTHYQSVYNRIYSNNKSIEPYRVQQAQKAVTPRVKTQPAKRDYLKDAEEVWNMPREDFAKLKAKVMAKNSL